MSFNFQKFSTTFFPKPSILSASFDIKCFIFSIEILSQLKLSLLHLLTASYFLVILLNSLTVLDPHEGHVIGNSNGTDFFFF